MKRMMILCLVLMVFPMSLYARQDLPAPQAQVQPPAAPARPQAPTPPYPAKVIAKWWKSSTTVSALSLSEKQVEQIEAVYLQHQSNLAKLRDLLLAEEEKLRTQLSADRLDEQAISKQKQALTAARAALESENSEMTLGMRRVITGEQWRKLEKIREDLMAPPPPPAPPAPPSVPPPPPPPAPPPRPVRRDSLAFTDKIYDAKAPGIVLPEILSSPRPVYTAEAKAARIEGMVLLQAVIGEDGNVLSVEVIQGVGYGLDEAAANAVRTQWKFRAGTKDGQPVKVRVKVEITFRLG
jgi:TonB family protein